MSQNVQGTLLIKTPLSASSNPFVNIYHDEQWDECQADQETVEVGEYAPVHEGNACIVLLQENCQDGADSQGRGEDETVYSLAEGVRSWGHFGRLEVEQL